MSDDAEPNPTVARRRLAVRLSRLREQNDRSLEDLARFLRVALPQASRLDTGARGFPLSQVKKLADWYQLDEPERAALVALVAESRRRAWWQQEKLADSYRTLIGMEQAATSINEYSSWVVPGLLQIPDYARSSAAGDAFGYDVDPDAIELAAQQAGEVRSRRQQVLARNDPPILRAVIDEAVLARTFGGAEVMGAQLAHLEEMSARPGIVVQVIDFHAGAYPGGSRGNYILVELNGELPDVLYWEGRGAPDDTSDEVKLAEYWRAWNEIRTKALDPYASRALIRRYRTKLATPQ